MRTHRWMILFYGSFFIVYVLIGLIDQVRNTDDVYPFSDWYLFSYVDRYGESFDLKVSGATGGEVFLSERASVRERRDLAHDLDRAVRFARRGEDETTKALVRDVAIEFGLKGKVTLVTRQFERMDYYKNLKWDSENEIATFEF